MNELMILRTASYLVVFLALTAYILFRAGRQWPQSRFLKLLALGALILLCIAVVGYTLVLGSVLLHPF